MRYTRILLKRSNHIAMVKECILTAVENICPEKLNLFGNIRLSKRTVSDRIKDIADDIQNSLKCDSPEFALYSLAIDEATDMSNIAQMAIFIRGLTVKFNIREEFPALKSVHGTTRGEELFQIVNSALKEFDLPYEKMCGLVTDGAPSMVGREKGREVSVEDAEINYFLESDKSLNLNFNGPQKYL
ncbi:Hypothetical predicted protein [Octopus vulgaris]|uniref:DUF4371 domain-containing protein n=1 Tax=Octopus vulgaris TaxID=6645 RepID=A0AA36F6U8_OCTVU|nr:Hypothetical predicted protein [Octopus vulgaris]